MSGQYANGGGGQLPFTGTDLIVYVIIGVGILALGLMIRLYPKRTDG